MHIHTLVHMPDGLLLPLSVSPPSCFSISVVFSPSHVHLCLPVAHVCFHPPFALFHFFSINLSSAIFLFFCIPCILCFLSIPSLVSRWQVPCLQLTLPCSLSALCQHRRSTVHTQLRDLDATRLFANSDSVIFTVVAVSGFSTTLHYLHVGLKDFNLR